MKRLIIYILVISFLVYTVSANVACGLVNKKDELSPQGLKVILYYSENKTDFTECLINPSNKYCCDLELLNSSFSKGKKIFAEIYDKETGYIAKRVEGETSSEGYSLLPPLELTEAIKVIPKEKVLLNESQINISIILGDFYKKVILFREEEIENLYENYTEINTTLNLSRGENKFTIVSGKEEDLNKTVRFYNLDFIIIKKEIDCDKNCEKNRIKSEEVFTLKSEINISHPVNISIKEYIPKEFEVLSKENKIGETPTHNIFEWKTNSTLNLKSFILKAPNTESFNNKEFTFETDAEVIKESTKLEVYSNKFFFVKKKKNKVVKNESSIKEYFKAIQRIPIVVNEENSSIIIAIEPRINKTEIFASIIKNEYDNFTEYNLSTNLKEEEIEKVFLRLKNDEFKLNVDERNIIEKEIKKDKTEVYLNTTNFSIIKEKKEYSLLQNTKKKKSNFLIVILLIALITVLIIIKKNNKKWKKKK